MEQPKPDPPQQPEFRMPTFDEIRAQEMMDNCAVRSVLSLVGGGGLGLFMGVLLASLDTPLNVDQMSAKEQFLHTLRQMRVRSVSTAKAFAVMGAIFAGAECMVEKARARHDITNTAIAGCVTGGAISAKGGPKAACFGCAGFSAFSVVIEKILNRNE